MLLLGLSETFISVGIWIASGIYNVAAVVFEIFLILSTGELISPDKYGTLISNFYIVIGIIMLFILAFALLRGMVNPDDQKQGTATVKKIIINLVTSGALMAALPAIFAFAYDFQDSILLEQNTIGKFFGYGAQGDTPVSEGNLNFVRGGAYKIVNGVYTAFFNVNKSNCDKIVTEEYATESEFMVACQQALEASDGDEKSFYDTAVDVESTGGFNAYNDFSEEVDDGKIDFNFLLSVIGGLLLIYVGVSYCFDMAVRLVKLIFYQLIAPIPLFLRIVPNTKFSDVFSKWIKVTLTCYLEVYIRIIIFYFCIYLCSKMLESDFLTVTVFQYGWFIAFLTKAFVLMGIITFMRQAPKLFQEITGLNSGNMNLGIKDKLAAGGGFIAGAALGSAGTALLRNATNAGSNVINRWKSDTKNEKVSNGRRFANALGGVAKGFGSIAAGTTSGFVRGGKASLNAKSSADMKNAIKKGAQDTVDARVKRANYKAAHSAGDHWYTDMGRVALGHIKDTGTKMASYAGIKNVDQLKRENYAIDLINNARDKFDNDADALIDKEMAKGLSKIQYGNGDNDFVNLDELSNMKREIENARAQGHLTEEMENSYNNARKKARYLLQNASLRSNENWEKLDEKIKAKLSGIRVDAVNYKGEIRNNSSLDALVASGIHGADFTDNKDYTLGVLKDEKVQVQVEVPNYVDKVEDVYEDREVTYYEDSSLVGSDGKPLKVPKKRIEKVKVGTTTKRVQEGTKFITEERVERVYDDNKDIDTMNKKLKVQKGDNNIAIAQKQQQKYEENKK